MQNLHHGLLVIHEAGDSLHFGNPQAHLRAEITVHDPAVWGLVAGNGSIGSGEAYIHGYWSTPDLTTPRTLLLTPLRNTLLRRLRFDPTLRGMTTLRMWDSPSKYRPTCHY